MTADNLTVILNKLHAMHATKILTMRQIALAVKTREQRCSEWITRRARRPNGEMTLRLLALAADQTIKIAASNRKVQSDYRSAYKAVCEKFPTE